MKQLRMSIPILMFSAAALGAQPEDPSFNACAFFQGLRSGDSTVVDSLVSSEALEVIDLMLTELEGSIRSDEDATLLRLRAAGYQAGAEQVREWSARDYLRNTVALPIMMARYAPYEMLVTSQTIGGDGAVLGVTFITASGFEIQSEVVLVEEDGYWKISSFMGLNSFP